MTTNTKSLLSSITFFVLLYVIYRFFVFTTGRGYGLDEVPWIIAIGVLLIISIGAVGGARGYYEKMKYNQTIKAKELDAEFSAYSILADEKAKHIPTGLKKK